MNVISSDHPRVAAALAQLRDSGDRLTPARRAVLQVVDLADRAGEHLTAETIGIRVAELAPSVHRATVYRTLTSLCQAGVLSQVQLGGAGSVYHLTTPGRPVEPPGDAATGSSFMSQLPSGHSHGHAHVRCLSCGQVKDVPSRVLETVARQLMTETGFALDGGRTALLGTCRDCRSEASR